MIEIKGLNKVFRTEEVEQRLTIFPCKWRKENL